MGARDGKHRHGGRSPKGGMLEAAGAPGLLCDTGTAGSRSLGSASGNGELELESRFWAPGPARGPSQWFEAWRLKVGVQLQVAGRTWPGRVPRARGLNSASQKMVFPGGSHWGPSQPAAAPCGHESIRRL
jgi:hypothetical protein